MQKINIKFTNVVIYEEKNKSLGGKKIKNSLVLFWMAVSNPFNSFYIHPTAHISTTFFNCVQLFLAIAFKLPVLSAQSILIGTDSFAKITKYKKET